MEKDLSNNNIIHVKKGKIEYLQFRRLLEYKNIIHCFTLRSNEYIDFNRHKPEKAQKSYKEIQEILGFDKIIKTKQKHTDIIEIIENGNEEFDQADGLITKNTDLAISTVAADCTSFLIFDPIKNIIANIHSGWRGTEKGIVGKAIETIKEKYNSNPEDLLCFICPSIRQCHFEVDEDVKDLFESKYGYFKNINEIIISGEKEGKYYIDTTEINKQIMLEKGIKFSNIIDSNICTVCNKGLFYSYRGDHGNTGRNTAIIELKK